MAEMVIMAIMAEMAIMAKMALASILQEYSPELGNHLKYFFQRKMSFIYIDTVFKAMDRLKTKFFRFSPHLNV